MADLENEIWKEIQDYPGYMISNYGRVRSYWKKGYKNVPKKIIDTFKLLKQSRVDSTGTYAITLCNTNGYYPHQTYRLVGIHFIPNPDNLPCLDHIDGNRTNNHVSNLRWTTYHGNNINISRKKKNSSGIRGIGIATDGRKKKFYAHAKIGPKKVKKYFFTLEEAIEFRKKLVKENYDLRFYNER